MLKKLIISPPFGNILNLDYATSICGTFTAEKRKGMLRQYLKTIRPVYRRKQVGWVNAIGLRNPGISNLIPRRVDNKIISIVPIVQNDIPILIENIENHIENKGLNFKAIEINIGCPNASFHTPNTKEVEAFQKLGLELILKIPPVRNYLDIIEQYSDAGIKYFHLFNSFGSGRGGASGEILKTLYARMILKVKYKFEDNINIIAGGGITSLYDIEMYKEVGADHYSISSLFFHPTKIFKFLSEYKNENIAV